MEKVSRIEIVVDSLNSGRVVELLAKQGLKGYTLIRGVAGSGERGLQRGDDLTEVSNNTYILTTCPADKLEAFLAALCPLLRRVGGICLVSEAVQYRG